MPFDADLYVKRTGSSTNEDLVLTPIFIGTAIELVASTISSGSSSIALSNSDSGLRLVSDYTTAKVSYWKLASSYSFGLELDGSNVIDLSQITLNEAIDEVDNEYACFIVNTNTNLVEYSVEISEFNFAIESDGTKTLTSIVTKENLTDISLNATNYAIYIGYLTTVTLTSSDLTTTSTSITIKNEVLTPISAGNLQTIKKINWSLYYKVVDYRYSVISSDDTIPNEFVSNEHNYLGKILAMHQSISTTDATLMTIPANTLTALSKALTIIEEEEVEGYYIVPLFNDPDPNTLISAFVQNMLSYNKFFLAIVSKKAFEVTEVANLSLEPGFGEKPFGTCNWGDVL